MVNDISPGVGPEVLCFPPAAKRMLRRWWPSFSLESLWPAHSRFVSAAPAPLTLGRRWRLRAEAPAEPGALPSPRLGWIRRPEWTLCKGQGKRHPYVSQLQSQTSSSTNFVTFPFLLLNIIKCLGDSCSNCLHYLK